MKTGLYPQIDYKKHLNEEQYTVVTKADGPCLVIAGAGAGKTRVLTYRICYLLEQGIRPESILLTTFTNKASREMTERIAKTIGFYPKGLLAGTFHHVANRVLRKHGKEMGLSEQFTILDSEDSLRLIKKLVRELGSEDEDSVAPGKIKQIISLAANKIENIRDVVNVNFPQFCHYTARIENISAKYQKSKKALNYMDYDDLMLSFLKLLKNHPIGETLSRQFKYILVDEYHDTNKLQSLILYKLSKTHRNILVVGDDAQSIYSFRGATINNILQFSKIYPGADVFYLRTNYRSTPEILGLANNIISHNRIQFKKKLVSVRNTGIKPVLVRCLDAKEEAAFISQRIPQLVGAGISPTEIGILFRSRYQAAELEIALNKKGIPYVLRGGLRFFEQAHIKDVVAYFRICENFEDEIAWTRLLAMCEGVGKKTIQKLLDLISKSKNIEQFNKNIQSIKLYANTSNRVKKLTDVLEKISSSQDSAQTIDLVLKSGYDEYLESHYRDAVERGEDLDVLKEISNSYETAHDFLAEVSLQENFKGEQSPRDKNIVLSTIHQAKGLEWQIVFIIGVCSNHFPHPLSTMDIASLEEERRILYVAATRAKEDLYISYYIKDFYRHIPSTKSIFIREIQPELFEEWNFDYDNG